ncbi:MAG: DUF4332 domain-containing protein [Cyanobacteria bacterium P01_A01_bin.84]
MSPPRKSEVVGVKSCNWHIEKLPGLSIDQQTQLRDRNISTTARLLKFASTPQDKLVLAKELQIHIQYINKWIALADLARIPTVGFQYCGLLLHSGIASVAQLAITPPHRLHQQILRLQVATLQRRDLCPAVEVVQQWVEQAKILG